jgi:ribosomal protein L7/L12
MLAPGSKGWINKYFELSLKGEFQIKLKAPEGLNNKEYLHYAMLKSGMVYGFASELLFAHSLNTSNWTTQEKLKVLLLEAHIFIYEQEIGSTINDKEKFKASLLEFYGKHNASAISGLFRLFIKESEDERIENILTKRLEVKGTLLEGKFWFNYLSNAFVYLDVILFRAFLRNKKESFSQYSELAQKALTAISLAAFHDGKIHDQEKAIFNVFLASANLSDQQKKIAQDRFKKGVKIEDLGEIAQSSWLLRRFVLDLSVLTMLANHTSSPDEYEYFDSFCAYLEVPKKEVNMAIAMTENFVLTNNKSVEFLKNTSSYEKIYSNLSRRWIKILGRNKDKLILEIKESKELMQLIRKSTKEELSKEEKELVKSQFLDIMKSMPALAIFMLPGGALLLPIVLRIIPDLIPSAFRDNELEG